MKTTKMIIVLVAFVALFASCKKNEEITPQPVEPRQVAMPVPGATRVGLNQPTIVTSSTTLSQYVATGSTGINNAASVAYHFTTTGGNATITEIHFTVQSGVTSLTIGSNTGWAAGGSVTISGLNLVIPTSIGANIQTLISYAGVGITGVPSNTMTSITMISVKYTMSNNGTTSTLPITIGASPNMFLVASVPAPIIIQPNVILATGNVEAIKVQVTASTKGDVQQNQISVQLNTTPDVIIGSVAGFILKDGSDNIIPCTVVNPSSGVYNIQITGGYIIPAGTTVTFKIFVPIVSVGNGGPGTSVMSTTLLPPGFIWTDIEGNGSVGGCTGVYIFGFPTNQSVIHN